MPFDANPRQVLAVQYEPLSAELRANADYAGTPSKDYRITTASISICLVSGLVYVRCMDPNPIRRANPGRGGSASRSAQGIRARQLVRSEPRADFRACRRGLCANARPRRPRLTLTFGARTHGPSHMAYCGGGDCGAIDAR